MNELTIFFSSSIFQFNTLVHVIRGFFIHSMKLAVSYVDCWVLGLKIVDLIFETIYQIDLMMKLVRTDNLLPNYHFFFIQRNQCLEVFFKSWFPILCIVQFFLCNFLFLGSFRQQIIQKFVVGIFLFFLLFIDFFPLRFL